MQHTLSPQSFPYDWRRAGAQVSIHAPPNWLQGASRGVTANNFIDINILEYIKFAFRSAQSFLPTAQKEAEFGTSEWSDVHNRLSYMKTVESSRFSDVRVSNVLCPKSAQSKFFHKSFVRIKKALSIYLYNSIQHLFHGRDKGQFSVLAHLLNSRFHVHRDHPASNIHGLVYKLAHRSKMFLCWNKEILCSNIDWLKGP